MFNKKVFRLIENNFIIIAAVIQFALAFVWMMKGGINGILDLISSNYIAASSSWLVDGYMGILYVLLVKLLYRIHLLYVFQMIAVGISALYLAKSLGFSLKNGILFTALTVTNPIVLQLIFSVKPEILVVSLIMLLIAFCKESYFIGILTVYIVAGLLNFDLIYVLLAFSIPLFAVWLVKEKMKGFLKILSFVVAFTVLFFAGRLSQTEYAYGRVDKTFDYLLMQRLSSGSVSDSWEVTSTYYGKNFIHEMVDADRMPDKLSSTFAYEFEKYAGKESANEVYKYIYKNSLAKGPGFYLKPIIRDFALYIATPFSVAFVYLTKMQGTLMATAMDAFLMGNSLMMKAYMLFSIFVLCVMTVLMFIRILGALKRSKDVLGIIYVCVAMAAYATLMLPVGFNYINAGFIPAAFILLYFSTLAGYDD